jgi:hypothetical protein
MPANQLAHHPRIPLPPRVGLPLEKTPPTEILIHTPNFLTSQPVSLTNSFFLQHHQQPTKENSRHRECCRAMSISLNLHKRTSNWRWQRHRRNIVQQARQHNATHLHQHQQIDEYGDEQDEYWDMIESEQYHDMYDEPDTGYWDWFTYTDDRLWGQLCPREWLFPLDSTPHSRFSQALSSLRSILFQAPNQKAWQTLCQTLSQLPHNEERPFLLDYAIKHIDVWPTEVRHATTDSSHPLWEHLHSLSIPAQQYREVIAHPPASLQQLTITGPITKQQLDWQQLASRCPHLTHLTLDWGSSSQALFQGLAHMTSLSSLSVGLASTTDHYFEARPITLSFPELPSLTALTLHNTRWGRRIDLAPIAEHAPHLQQLTLHNISIYSNFPRFPQLTTLTLYNVSIPYYITEEFQHQGFPGLRYLQLERSSLPLHLEDFEDAASTLTHLHVREQGSFSLEGIHAFQQLTSLTCSDARPLPIKQINQCKALRHLVYDGTMRFEEFHHFPQLLSLELHIHDIPPNTRAPSFPETLEHLEINDSAHISAFIIDSNTDLPHLQTLTARELAASQLNALLHTSPNLQKADITGSYEDISLANNSQLHTLCIRRNNHLQELPPLPSTLDTLELYHCHALQDIENIRHASTLRTLRCIETQPTRSLDAIGSLTRLRDLFMTDGACLPFVQYHPHLASLTVMHGCQDEQWQQVPPLPSLQRLELAYAKELSTLGDMTRFPHLREALFHQLPASYDLTPLQDCPQLQALGIWDTSLPDKALSSIKELHNMTLLSLRHCPELTDLSPLSAWTSLQELDVEGCTQLKHFDALGELPFLQYLRLNESAQGTLALSDTTFVGKRAVQQLQETIKKNRQFHSIRFR